VVLNCIHAALDTMETARSVLHQTPPDHHITTTVLHCLLHISWEQLLVWLPPAVFFPIRPKKRKFGLI
jgi:hypothetical protein